MLKVCCSKVCFYRKYGFCTVWNTLTQISVLPFCFIHTVKKKTGHILFYFDQWPLTYQNICQCIAHLQPFRDSIVGKKSFLEHVLPCCKILNFEPSHDKTIKMACASTQSDQSFAVHMKKALVLSYPLSASKDLIRPGGCPGWSESSLGTHAILLILLWGGSFYLSWLLWNDWLDHI